MALCALAEVSNLSLVPPGARIGNASFLLRWNERDMTINMDAANETVSWHAVQMGWSCQIRAATSAAQGRRV